MAALSVRNSNGSSGAPSVSGRVSRPAYYSPFSGTGFGVVPRRGLDAISRRFLWGDGTNSGCYSNNWWDTTLHPALLAQFSATFPLRLLRLIAETNPIVAMARRNNICLAFAPGDTKIVAVKQAGGDSGQDQIDDAGTAELEDFFTRHGGLAELQEAGANAAMTDALLCFEAVPGPSGTGLADVFTFDSLTTQFRQGKAGEPPLVLQQNQQGEWKDLPGETVFWKAVGGTRDNPYGVPIFSSVVTEALQDANLQRTLADVLQNAAWPRLAVGFDLPMLIEFASTKYADLGLAPPGSPQTADGPLTVTEWAVQQFQALQTLMEGIKAADTFIFTKGSEPKVLEGGNLQGTEGTLQMQRHRLVMAVDQPPTLLGIDTGGTLAYSSTQWKAYALKLEALRAFVNGILVKIANLHLQLLGADLTARAEVEPIRSEDILILAQARGLDIQNEKSLIGMGFTSPEDACVRLTGSGIVDEEKAKKIGEPVEASNDAPGLQDAAQGAQRAGARAPKPPDQVKAFKQQYAANIRARRLAAEQAARPKD